MLLTFFSVRQERFPRSGRRASSFFLLLLFFLFFLGAVVLVEAVVMLVVLPLVVTLALAVVVANGSPAEAVAVFPAQGYQIKVAVVVGT